MKRMFLGLLTAALLFQIPSEAQVTYPGVLPYVAPVTNGDCAAWQNSNGVIALTDNGAVCYSYAANQTPELVAQVTLTSAQVLALNTTPISIIPAPATGQLVIIDSVTYKGTTAYTQAAGAGLVYHGGTTAADGSYANTADPFINGTTFSYGLGGINAHAGTNQSVGAVRSLGVDAASITTNPTVGTAPVTITVQYRIMTP